MQLSVFLYNIYLFLNFSEIQLNSRISVPLVNWHNQAGSEYKMDESH